MKRSRDVAIEEKVEFNSLLQNKLLLKGLERSGYEQPSPVQLKAIPLGRLGVDLIAQAKSGTGKTVVFGVLTLESINVALKYPQAIVIAPTREIAVQIRDVIRDLGHYMKVKCHAFIGGLPASTDHQHLSGCHVIVGTPGRLMALLESKKLNTDHIKLFVMDEADKMMSDTFRPQVDYIFSKIQRKNKVIQSVAFSATFTDELLKDLSGFLKDPRIVKLTDGMPTLNEVQQYYTRIDTEKDDSKLIVYQKKFQMVEKILGQVPFYQCMIFVNSLHRSLELSNWLNEMGWKSGQIHAGLAQDKRLLVMENMRNFNIRILVCSDLIARGIDIDRVNLVINVDIPFEIETYLHRIGRTGRYGTSGIAVTITGQEDEAFLEGLQTKGITIDQLPDKVSHNQYIKQLTESEQATLTKHESIEIQPKALKLKGKQTQQEIKPIKSTIKFAELPSLAEAEKLERPKSIFPPLPSLAELKELPESPLMIPNVKPKISDQQQTSFVPFIPPDLYF